MSCAHSPSKELNIQALETYGIAFSTLSLNLIATKALDHERFLCMASGSTNMEKLNLEALKLLHGLEHALLLRLIFAFFLGVTLADILGDLVCVAGGGHLNGWIHRSIVSRQRCMKKIRGKRQGWGKTLSSPATVNSANFRGELSGAAVLRREV